MSEALQTRDLLKKQQIKRMTVVVEDIVNSEGATAAKKEMMSTAE